MKKEKRHRKFRGRRTYHGSHKKHRGGGSRGGRGQAGMHKHKWSLTVAQGMVHFGKNGFKRPYAKSVKAVNLGKLSKIAEKKKVDSLNVLELGYQKVLGAGRLSKPLTIEAESFSKKAVEKIEKIKGKAVKI